VTLARSLAPAAVGVAVAGLLTLYLLTDDNPIGPWLLAFLLAAHGWVHLLFAFPKPPAGESSPQTLGYPFDFSTSWLIERGVDGRRVEALGRVLMAVVVVVQMLAALATVGLLVPVDWWAALVLLAALASAIFLALFYSPLLLLGFAIDLALVLLVLTGAWSPAGG
jgi:hypothetical protein